MVGFLLRLLITAVALWVATQVVHGIHDDGRPLTLQPYAGIMLQARIPAGAHSIVLRYWPKAFTDGILLAIGSAVFLSGLLIVTSFRKRRRSVASKPTRSSPRSPAS